MGHKAEIARGIGVAEGGDGGSKFHQSGYQPHSVIGEVGAGGIEQGVGAVVACKAHMHMHPRSGLTGGDLWCEGHIKVLGIGEIAYHPFGQHQLIGGVAGRHGQKFYLILLVDHVVEGEIAHLRVAVFDLRAGLGDIVHAAGAEVVEFRKGHRLVVAALVGGGKHAVARRYHIVFQFAHRLEVEPGGILKCLAGLAQRVLRRCVERLPFFGEEAAEHGQGRHGSERIDEGGAVAGYHVEVAVAGLHKREEA